MKRMTRGQATFGALTVALDELGVRPGEDFLLAKAEPTPRMDDDTPGGVRSSDPDTSREAARTLGKSGTKRRAAFDAIAAAGMRGLTAHEVGEVTGLEGIWKRCSELKDWGYIRTVGDRFVKATGKDQEVYVASDKGRAEAGLIAPKVNTMHVAEGAEFPLFDVAPTEPSKPSNQYEV